MNDLPPLIGLSGKAGSGKSTVAAYLTNNYGFHQFAFAEVLKEVVQTAFHFTPAQMTWGKEDLDPRCGKSPRWCLQHFGSAFREVWPEIWIWHLDFKIKNFQKFWQTFNLSGPCRLVVTDMRFVDEVAALQRLGAVLWRLERPGAGARRGIPGHISETELDSWPGFDQVILNDSSQKLLFDNIDRMLRGEEPLWIDPATPERPGAGEN